MVPTTTRAQPDRPEPGDPAGSPVPGNPAESASAARSTAASESRDAGLSGWIMRWLAPLLALVSWGLGWALSPMVTDRQLVLWALAPMAGLLLLRAVLERSLAVAGAGSIVVTLTYGAHLSLVAVATALNPLTCIYAFVGYPDSRRFLRGGAAIAAFTLTAVLCAAGQSGGIPVIVTAPVLFAALVAVNLGVAGAMNHQQAQRDREVAERERATQELQASLRTNAALQRQLVVQARASGAAQERTRIAREIHDTVAQGLIGVIRQLDAVPLDAAEPGRERIARAQQTARECLAETRRAVRALAPHQLEGTGVLAAIAEHVAAWAHTHRVVVTFDGDDAPETVAHGATLFRLVQESLSNVARHARARTVQIAVRAAGSRLVLTVQDDGRGFDPQHCRPGHGLQIMAERVQEAGGTFGIETAPGAGTRIEASLPQ
ncbi:signal transduction histidine kinase [Kineosphaera limosa]|uniref:sensor histidine kinase n=1 Tax=Kineosphaera limosa TaxID=111564 RepID=UPI000A0273FA|nr:sensor histidine kinase [Kineosphaera limosa]NYE00784.1 signal transduction histidine kinase [Kineosphaera limosa]